MTDMHEHTWALISVEEPPKACHVIRTDMCECGAQRAVWPETEDYIEIGPGDPEKDMYVKVSLTDLKYCQLYKLWKCFSLTKLDWDRENARIASGTPPQRLN